jgi:hypothetical protein
MSSTSQTPTHMANQVTFAERAGRWLAARTTRRSFLGTVGKVGLVAAGGSVLSQVLADRAEARVCGQSGVSPKCPTFDCLAPSVWGWCWYAGNASCCADGGLKKICDCCRANHPNVHGYCPEGSNVYCVVESCLEDPRVMKVIVNSYNGSTAAAVGIQRTAAFASASLAAVVIAHPTDRFLAALATPVAARITGAVLTTPLEGLLPEVATEITRLGAKRVVVVGSGFSPAVLESLAALVGAEFVEHIGTNPSVPAASIEVARWMGIAGAQDSAIVIGTGGQSQLLAPAAGAAAALDQSVLLIGVDAANALRAERSTVGLTFVGEATPGASAADRQVTGADAGELARKLAELRVAAEPAALWPIALVVGDDSAFSSCLVQPGNMVVLHGSDLVDAPTRDWLLARRAKLSAAHVAAGGRAGLSEQRVYEVQSAVNGFNAHLLIGGDGMGIPVIPQPNEEKAIGRARVTGPAPTTPKPMSKRTRPTTTVKGAKKPVGVTPTTGPATTVPPAAVPATVPVATTVPPTTVPPTTLAP